jgi:hypothetical protein
MRGPGHGELMISHPCIGQPQICFVLDGRSPERLIHLVKRLSFIEVLDLNFDRS